MLRACCIAPGHNLKRLRETKYSELDEKFSPPQIMSPKIYLFVGPLRLQSFRHVACFVLTLHRKCRQRQPLLLPLLGDGIPTRVALAEARVRDRRSASIGLESQDLELLVVMTISLLQPRGSLGTPSSPFVLALPAHGPSSCSMRRFSHR